MHAAGKASPRWGKGQSVEELRAKQEPEEADRKVQESLDTLIMHTMGDSYASLANRSGDKPVQCIYWPDAFDQHLASKLTRGMKVEVGAEMRDGRAEENSPVGLRDSSGNGLNGFGGLGKTFQAAGERLRVPQAVVAFAQAAVKVNDLPGWPLLSPAKVQMQKCEKCSQEFYSSLNYRRHIRIHRRSLHANKEDLRKEKTRIATFWNKLTLETVSQILSIKNTMIEDLSGMATVRALTALIQQPRLSLLPQTFVKSGTALLDVLQGKGLAHFIPADELFSILDDASENTFLCGGTSASVQRFVYHGEAGKLGLEDRNLVASLAFLIEQKLVKAWMIDKDVEALRCQKELVEEEEAAQKRKEKILEKKRQKKLRQKEKEKKEASLQLVFHDQENDSIDNDSILRLEEEGDSPLGSGSSSMSLASSKKDLNRTEASDLQMAQFVAQLEENILLKSMHTFDQLVRSASEEELHDEEHQISIDYILPSQEESSCETIDPLQNDRVHQEMFPAFFQGKDEIVEPESKYTWKYPKSLHYHKISDQQKYSDEKQSSKQKAGKNSQERMRFDQLEYSLQPMRNLTDANSTEDDNLEGPDMNKSSNELRSLFTNRMRRQQSVLVTTDESHSLVPKQCHSKLPGQSRASANVFSGNAVWAKKTRLSSSVDQSKNIEQSMASTPIRDGRTDSSDEAFFQTLPAENLKTNKIICPSLASNYCSISIPLSGALSSSSYKPNDLNKVHEIGCSARRTLQGSNSQPCVLNEEAISGITNSQDPANLSAGPDAAMEESRIVSTSNVGANGLSDIHDVVTTIEPVGSFGNELLIGSLKVPLNTIVADTFAHEGSILFNGLGLNSVSSKSSDNDSGQNLPEFEVRDVYCVEEQPRVSESRIKSVNRNNSKVVQSLSSVTNELTSNEGTLSNSGHSLALRKASRAVGTLGWNHEDETYARSESSTIDTSTLLADSQEQTTTSQFAEDFTTGSSENILELDVKDSDRVEETLQNHLSSSCGDAQVRARDREANIAQEWCKKKDDNFYTKCVDKKWLSISDLAVAAFLSQRKHLC